MYPKTKCNFQVKVATVGLSPFCPFFCGHDSSVEAAWYCIAR